MKFKAIFLRTIKYEKSVWKYILKLKIGLNSIVGTLFIPTVSKRKENSKKRKFPLTVLSKKFCLILREYMQMDITSWAYSTILSYK